MLYEDVLSFFSQTGVGYTPTLGVTYGGPGGEPYWIQESQVWKHPLLTQHVPTDVLNAELVRVETGPEADYADQGSAGTADMRADGGVPVSLGAQVQQQCIAAHWR